MISLDDAYEHEHPRTSRSNIRNCLSLEAAVPGLFVCVWRNTLCRTRELAVAGAYMDMFFDGPKAADSI